MNVRTNHRTLSKRHNPYFNRWFSAMTNYLTLLRTNEGHNPYFNRWFSAIRIIEVIMNVNKNVTILILIDGFLQ